MFGDCAVGHLLTPADEHRVPALVLSGPRAPNQAVRSGEVPSRPPYCAHTAQIMQNTLQQVARVSEMSPQTAFVTLPMFVVCGVDWTGNCLIKKRELVLEPRT